MEQIYYVIIPSNLLYDSNGLPFSTIPLHYHFNFFPIEFVDFGGWIILMMQ